MTVGDLVIAAIIVFFAMPLVLICGAFVWVGLTECIKWATQRSKHKGTTEHSEPQERTYSRPWVEDWYGDHHRAERAKYAAVIREHGGVCLERECIMPSRHIAPGAYWHLAHDHEAGGQFDYLGPAHPECNQHEARSRGVTWDNNEPDDDRDNEHQSDGDEEPENEYDWAESVYDEQGEEVVEDDDWGWWAEPSDEPEPHVTGTVNAPTPQPPSGHHRSDPEGSSLFSDEPFG